MYMHMNCTGDICMPFAVLYHQLPLGMDTIGAILAGNNHISTVPQGGVRYFHLVSAACVGVCMINIPMPHLLPHIFR